MSPLSISIATLLLTFGSALAGMRLQRVVPTHHLSDASRQTVNLAIGLVATLTALVLGLVTASTKSSFDEKTTTIKQTAAELLSIDRVLARYGPETAEIREALKRAVASRVDVVWHQGWSGINRLDPSETGHGVEFLATQVSHLAPQTDDQRWLRSRALKLSEKLLDERWSLFASSGSSVPLPFLVTLLFWLAITFVCIGLFAPQNRTVRAVLFVCSLSVASAVLLVLELDQPFEGMITVSPEPLNNALAHLAQ